MAISKVVYKSSASATPVTWIDATSATAVAADITSPKTAMLANGVVTQGTGSGGTSRPNIEDPVKFWDYDGTLLYSYTDAQALALTELPPNPSHTGLVAEGWNWTLAEIKSYATDYPDGDINVGQTYITASGDTEIYVTLDSATLHPYLKLAVNGTVEVDWGDNSTPSTMTGSSDSTLVWADHQYAAVGDYKISISVQSGRFTFKLGDDNNGGGVFSNTDSVNRNLIYSSIVTKILFGSSVRCDTYAFQYLVNLNTVSISKTVIYLANLLFRYAYSLKHITLPTLASLYSISSDCYQCYNLKSASIPKNVQQSGCSNTFSSCYNLLSVTYPDNQTMFDCNFMNNCNAITKIVIPDSTTYINSNFYNLYNLKKIITNKTTVDMSGTLFFSHCYALESIPFSITCTNSGATNKMSSLFYNCYNLKSIPTWTRSVGNTTQWGNYVYGGCYKIRTAYIPSTITDLGSYAFQSCYCLESVTLPSNLELIGTSCFYNCYSLPSITIPNTVTSIGNQGFNSCYSLSSITLSNTLTTLGASCFQNCTSLTTLTIPATVTSIGNQCFASMQSMQEFHFLRTSPPTSGTTPFTGIPSGCKIYVPYSADHSILNAYKSATNWSTYANYIEEEPQA